MNESAVLYVYYKLPAARHAELATKVRSVQAGLAQAWPGLACELLQRPEASDGAETWMETYRHDTALSTGIIDAIARAAAQAGLPSPRHTEIFVPLH